MSILLSILLLINIHEKKRDYHIKKISCKQMLALASQVDGAYETPFFSYFHA